MPNIIVGECGVLVVDEIGKNYSGTGVDLNITGTFSTKYASGGVKVQRTAMLSLSEESHGNGLGTGLASAIAKGIFDKLDLEKIYTNLAIESEPEYLEFDEEEIYFRREFILILIIKLY
jgi:hypothetical protein